ncbi:class I SAM-dependent methyltransferase [Streptomyces sp. TRM49041]|uniref:class I SAM-dependent methyltransferase n=1 Tax=Streptomyces sp. TRM49041 TaxID=2603216 RepID=UPI0011F0664A|nr:class I SAM-dependent methyltransferase [Streptomyces sp. TRM49041]
MTTTATQEAFLRSFHAERPAVTVEAMGRGRGPRGLSSYELLCELVDGAGSVLDLGCGDGALLELLGQDAGRALAGVDLSAEALALAYGRSAIPRGATLVQGRGQELPFVDGAFDACVSHMALMLMGDVEQVVAEVARVLVPGGVLACVVGGGPGGDGEAYDVFLRLLKPLVRALPADRRIPALGDRRTRSRDGLDDLLRDGGFGPVEWETLPLRLSGSVEEVWTTLSGMYDLGPLDPSDVASLRKGFLGEVERIRTPSGDVPCAMWIHLARARLLR